MPTAEDAYAAIEQRLLLEPDAERRRAFASDVVMVRGKIAVMLVRGELVVKLPAERCVELVAAGRARPFETAGRTMRQWVCFPDPAADDWDALADEAVAFARS